MSVRFWRVRRLIHKPVGSLVVLLLLACPAFGRPAFRQVAEGITLIQEVKGQPDAPVAFSALKIDMSRSGVRVESALGGDTVIENSSEGRENPSTFTRRRGVLAAVNADFFPFTGDPLGMAVVNGEFVSEPFDGRAVFGLRADGKPVFDRLVFQGEVISASGTTYKLHGLNRARGNDEMVLYAPIFGASTRTKVPGIEMVLSSAELPVKANKPITAKVESLTMDASSTPIPAGQLVLSAAGKAGEWVAANIHQGDSITIKPFVKSYNNLSWDDVQQAVGGYPFIVRDGKVTINPDGEKMEASFSTSRHPRTGVGVTANGELLLVTVDGRQSISRGMSLPEFGELMKSLGAVTAINLDGGGSTALSLKGLVINSPSGGTERPVANMVSINAPVCSIPCGGIKFASSEITAQSGIKQPLNLVNASTGAPLSSDDLSKVVWGTTGGVGLVDQNGMLYPVKAMKGTVVAMLGDQQAEIIVDVQPGPAVKLAASLEEDPTGAENRAQVTASVTDADGNSPGGTRITIDVTGGTPDFPDGLADEKGKIVFGITWDESIPQANRKVVVTSGSLPVVTLKQ